MSKWCAWCDREGGVILIHGVRFHYECWNRRLDFVLTEEAWWGACG